MSFWITVILTVRNLYKSLYIFIQRMIYEVYHDMTIWHKYAYQETSYLGLMNLWNVMKELSQVYELLWKSS